MALLQAMTDLFNTGDGGIVVTFNDGRTFHAHSDILVARSPVLKAELSAPMIERQSQAISMQCDADSGKAFLRFVYTGKLDVDSLSSLLVVQTLAHLADYYQVDGFDAAFTRPILKHLNSLIKDVVPQTSDTFWEDLVGEISRLPDKVSQAIVGSYAWKNLTFGQDSFIALCVAINTQHVALQEACLRAISNDFEHWSTSTWGTRDQLNLLAVVEVSFRQEFAETRLAECIMRASPTAVLAAYSHFQSKVLSNMKLVTRVHKHVFSSTDTVRYVNEKQEMVLSLLAKIGRRITELAMESSIQPATRSTGNAMPKPKAKANSTDRRGRVYPW